MARSIGDLGADRINACVRSQAPARRTRVRADFVTAKHVADDLKDKHPYLLDQLP